MFLQNTARYMLISRYTQLRFLPPTHFARKQGDDSLGNIGSTQNQFGNKIIKLETQTNFETLMI